MNTVSLLFRILQDVSLGTVLSVNVLLHKYHRLYFLHLAEFPVLLMDLELSDLAFQ